MKRMLVAVLFLGTLSACHSSDPNSCVPGAIVACPCGGNTGAQTCLSDGTFGPCDCPPECVQNTDCPDSRPICTPTQTCVACRMSEDCSEGESCDFACGLCTLLAGRCATDAQCAIGETCQPVAAGCTVQTCQVEEGAGGTGGAGGGSGGLGGSGGGVDTGYDDVGPGHIPQHHKGWAASNVYYDHAKGHMTFDDIATGEHPKPGIFFKWGSLYGVDCTPYKFSGRTNIYAPGGGITEAHYFTWETIPYVSDSLSIKPDIKRAYLYEIHDPAKGIGDICKYLSDRGYAPAGKKWRMPTAEEFSESHGHYSDLGGSFEGSQTSCSSGGHGYKASPGLQKFEEGRPFFPAAEHRAYGDITLNPFKRGVYSSSSASNERVVNFSFYKLYDGVLHHGTGEWRRDVGTSVRCVVE